MRCLLTHCVFWSLSIVLLLQWDCHQCCVQDERMALLQIKSFFTINTNNVILPSWLETDDDDCCNWERVTCNPVTARVTNLTLQYLRQDYASELSLNVTLFSPFEELVNLQLSGNVFSCCVNNQGFDNNKLIHLKRLEALDLADNHFDSTIMNSFGNLTKLKYLNLSFNWIDALFPLQEWAEQSNMTNLETLDLKYNGLFGLLTAQDVEYLKNIKFLILSNNQLSGTIPAQAFTRLKNLKVLDLSENRFMGSIPPAIGASSSLVALSLFWNNLTGTLPHQELCKLEKLEELDLSGNHLEGLVPQCFSNLSSLRGLDLSRNQFRGEISFIIYNLTSLEYIRVGNNHFEGKFSFSLLANHSKIKLVDIINNGNLEVETEDSNWIPKFQLEVLALSGCNLNKYSHKIPTFLAYQSMLKVLDLSHNNLVGSFPNWVIKNNSELKVLNLRNNSLEGKLHLQRRLNNTSVSWMDVSGNQFNGKLQENVGRMLYQIKYLNLSSNQFEGFVPSSFCNMSVLHILDLSNNYFDGEINMDIVSGCLGNLNALILSANRFHGQILSTHFNMTELSILHIGDNQFSGPISNAIIRSFWIRFLDASDNNFSGELHSWLRNMTHLETLIIRNNSLNGHLPCQVPISFLLDISHNSLVGPLPSCPYIPEHLLIQSNEFTGLIPETLLNSSILQTLDIRDNNLSGNFPSVIGAKNLRILLLGGNQLSGSFPNQLCWLQKLTLIDLSNNHLSGEIPRCINNVSFGKSSLLGNFEDHFVFEMTHEASGVMFGNLLVESYGISTNDERRDAVVIDFISKRRSNSYKGYILNLMSGLDLSCNKFTGKIPHELGNLSGIHTLNLSHNQIKGSIPASFSGLRQLESLDLSYNNLTGKVPPELIDLNFLAIFSVAHNNLSGRIHEMKGQFGTFDQNNYEGNPYLCGELLANKCSKIIEPSPPTPPSELTSEAKWYEIDMLIFWVAFIVAFIIFFLGVVISLYVNPYWSRRLWNFVDDCYYACYFKFCM